MRMLDLNGEAYAPAWYAAILWFLASLSTMITAAAESVTRCRAVERNGRG